MAHLSLEGSVVSYEFLDAKKKWRWGVGAVTHSDDRVCIIDQWAGAPVDKTMTAKLESEAAFSKAEAKSHQEHLLSIRERINSQDRMTSKEEKERASKELSECLALIGKHRNRSRSLLADLETMKGSSTVQLKCQQFTPACSSLAILRSSILRVISQTKVPSVVLSSEEVDSIEQSVCSNHSQLNGELRKLRAIFEATEIESNLLRDQIRDLEEQLKHLKNISEPTEIPDRGESVSTFPEKKEEDDSVNLHGAWEIRTALVTTKHTFTFPWDDGDTTLHHKPEETKSLFAAEAAFACCVPIQYVTNIKMTTLGKHLSAEFSVSHPVTVTTKEIDRRLAVYAFPSIQLLHEEPLGVKTGLDKAIESLENALGIPEGKHEGLCFDEFMEIMPDTTFSNDKDAYESEIGDLLMLLDRLNNENRSLQYTLDKSAAEFKRQLSDAQRDHDELNTEISCLRNLIAKLKDLAEEQEKEVESHRLQKQRAEQDRLHHDLPPPAPSLQNEEYAVTISEYNHQKEAAEHALAALTEREEKEKELHNLLKAYEQKCAQYAQHLSSLEQAFAADQDQAAKTSTALESELLDILLHLKASQASVDALRHINSQQHKELEAFRAKRNAALEARDADGTLPVPAKPVSMSDAAARALEPQQIADEPLYAVTVEEYMDKDAAVEQLTAELEEQRAEAERLAEEVAAFRAKRNAALEARDADGTLPVPAKPVSMSDAAARALEPQQIADEPLYAVTVEELCAYRKEADSMCREVKQLGLQVSEKAEEAGDLLEKLEEAVSLLAEARKESDIVRGDLGEAERALEVARGEWGEERGKLMAELSAMSKRKEELDAEARAFRKRRLDAVSCREMAGGLACEGLGGNSEDGSPDVPVPSVIIEQEPLFCVKLEELNEQRELNAQMVLELSDLGERIRDAMDPGAVTDPSNEAVLSHLEALLKALEESRAAEQTWRELAEERERDLEQLRKLFENEEERLKNDLAEARDEVERLQGELDLLTDKLDEACRLFCDADAVSAEGVAKLEAFAEVLAASRDAEKAAMEQLEANENELEELRIALKDAKSCEERLEHLEDELTQLQKEKAITETELDTAQKEMNNLRCDLRAAEDRSLEKAREVERMTLDLDALNSRIQDLLEELEEKTEQYNQVIKDLDEFANNQSHENEKELLQRLAAREQELFELQEARRGENNEHEKQVGVLQDQINRLRDQTDQDNTLHGGLQEELARLRKLLLDAEAALRDKTAENDALKDDMEGMIDEHEAQMREVEQELEAKGKEVSDALERLEEMSAMVQEAREGEESALRLRADSDAQVFRLQKELDSIKQLQNAIAESGDDKSRLFAQIIETESQLRDAVAIIGKKDAEMDEMEKEWQKKLSKSEDLNHELRRLLKRTMAALSKSKDTMGNSAGSLDAFRDELKPMMQ